MKAVFLYSANFFVLHGGQAYRLPLSGANIKHDEADRAYYSSVKDEIHLPDKNRFASQEQYYATALHELGHWTGHSSRLNRQLGNTFGSQEYAKEELRAEIASLFIASETGVPHHIGQHAAYVKSWIEVLKNDKNEIFRAARDADKIAEYVLGIEKEKDLDKQKSEHHPKDLRPITLREAIEKASITMPNVSFSRHNTETKDSKLFSEAFMVKLAEHPSIDKQKHFAFDSNKNEIVNTRTGKTEYLVSSLSKETISQEPKTQMHHKPEPTPDISII